MGEGFPGGGMSWGGMNWGGMNQGQTASNSSNEIDNSKGTPTGVSDEAKGKKIKKLEITGPLKEFYQMPSDDMDSNAVSDNGGLKERDIDRKNVDTTPEQITQTNVEVGDESKERDTDWEDVEATPEQIAQANVEISDEGASNTFELPENVPDPFELDLFEEESDKDVAESEGSKADSDTDKKDDSDTEVKPEEADKTDEKDSSDTEAKPEEADKTDEKDSSDTEVKPEEADKTDEKEDFEAKRAEVKDLRRRLSRVALEAEKRKEAQASEAIRAKYVDQVRDLSRRFSKVEQEVRRLRERREQLESELEANDREYKSNIKEHEELLEEVESAKKTDMKSKGGIMKKLYPRRDEFEKKLEANKHDEIEEVLESALADVRRNREEARATDGAEARLRKNEQRWAELIIERDEKRAELKMINAKLPRSEKNKELIEEEVASRSKAADKKERKKEIKRGREEFRSEHSMSPNQRRKELDEAELEADERYDYMMADIDELRDNKIIRAFAKENGLAKGWRRKVEGLRERERDDYDQELHYIRDERDKLDKLYPTWGARIETLVKEKPVRSALSSLKRNILLRLRFAI